MSIHIFCVRRNDNEEHVEEAEEHEVDSEWNKHVKPGVRSEVFYRLRMRICSAF